MLTHKDIRDFLEGFAAAIELDEIRVDALPMARFHSAYDAGMWRRYRRGHLDLIDRLLSPVTEMSSDQLQEVGWLAITCRPEVVRQVKLDLFCDAATGMIVAGEVETARLNF